MTRITRLRLAGALFFPAFLFAQDNSKPVTLGGFENQGSITTGYRFADVSGYRPKYQELFDLNSGFRLLDFSLFGKAKPGEDHFADDYSLTLSGLGGEPFSSAQFTVRKKNLYDLRVNFRQSYYYWNHNDLATLPNGLSGLTSNHDWSTVRKLGSVNFLIHATHNLRFSFEYNRNTRDGVTFTTRSLDYFGSSATWGAFARANPYYMIAPVSEDTDRVTGGLDYTRGDWTLHYKIGYQRFQDAVNGANVSSPENSININDPTTAAERLSGASWIDSRKLTTPVSEFSYTGKITKKLDTRGGYLFYRYQGPATLNMSFNGIARTNTGGTADAPYAVSLATNTNVTEPDHIVDQGFTYKAKEWWDVLIDYRYSRLTTDSLAQFRSVNASLISVGNSSNQWLIGTSTLDVATAFTPIPSLLVRAGVRLFKSDVENFQDLVIDPTLTKRIKTVWPIGSVYYHPSKIFTVRANVDEINNGTSYTRVTPHTDVGGRVTARFRPTDKFYLEDTALVRNRKLLDTGYTNTVRSNAVTATYEFNDRLSGFAGFSYDSIFTSDFADFLRGPSPITNVAIRDQTVDRVWQGGIKIAVTKRFGFNFTGNFVRTTGLGQIAGEAPLYGPITFPYATGSLHYDFARLGRLAVELQRTYYLEQIVPGNNFGAKLLTVAWTRGF